MSDDTRTLAKLPRKSRYEQVQIALTDHERAFRLGELAGSQPLSIDETQMPYEHLIPSSGNAMVWANAAAPTISTAHRLRIETDPHFRFERMVAVGVHSRAPTSQ